MSHSITAILVDDEESARDVLENLLLRFCPQVHLLGKYGHLEDAVPAIRELRPQLVFLDIEMPNYAGYEIVRFFPEINFHIIFVTAYDKYAIRAFEVSAMDYLMKPIDIQRLQTAVERVGVAVNLKQQAERMQLLDETLQTREVKRMAISDKGMQYVLDFDAIIALEAQESYTILHTSEKRYVASKNLKHFERLLVGDSSFIRVHKSWIINLSYLLNYSKSDLVINLKHGIAAKLSKYKKAEFEEVLLQ